MTDTADHFPAHAKKRMLMAALEVVKDLQDIQLADEKAQVINPGAPTLDYDKYCILLSSATTRLDDLQSKHGRSQSRRSTAVKAHKVDYAVKMAEADYFGDGEMFLQDEEEPPEEPPALSYSAYGLGGTLARIQQAPGPD